MKLSVSRSQEKQHYTLSLKAEIPDDEWQILCKHKKVSQYLGLPKNISDLCLEKKIHGPRLTSPSFFQSLHYLTGGITLITPEALANGIELTCDVLPEGFNGLPDEIKQRYDELLGSLRVQDGWGGCETLS